MKKKLATMAKQLSEKDIQEIIRLKKMEDKKAVALRKKRDRLAADLAKIEQQLAAYLGEGAEAADKPRAGRGGRRKGAGRKPAAKAGAKKTIKKKPAAKQPAQKTVRGGRRKTLGRGNLSAAVREVFAKAGAPLKASQVVDGLPEAGIKVKDVAQMRKRISVVLASQKNHFEQVERGVYQLKD